LASTTTYDTNETSIHTDIAGAFYGLFLKSLLALFATPFVTYFYALLTTASQMLLCYSQISPIAVRHPARLIIHNLLFIIDSLKSNSLLTNKEARRG